jgi:hypothetical protein
MYYSASPRLLKGGFLMDFRQSQARAREAINVLFTNSRLLKDKQCIIHHSPVPDSFRGSRLSYTDYWIGLCHEYNY